MIEFMKDYKIIYETFGGSVFVEKKFFCTAENVDEAIKKLLWKTKNKDSPMKSVMEKNKEVLEIESIVDVEVL